MDVSQGSSFWPQIYLTNVTREKYPKLLGKYGTPGKLMKAEKEYLLGALNYHVMCREQDTKEKCNTLTEKRHISRKNNAYSQRSAYHICRYDNKKGCVAKKATNKLSLQFLRWLLAETDQNAFLSYVAAFPHQLTEVDYGYDHDTDRETLTTQDVTEIKRQILSSNPNLGNLPKGHLQEVQRLISDSPMVEPSSRLSSRQVAATPDECETRLKMAFSDNKDLEKKLKQTEKDLQSSVEEIEALSIRLKNVMNDNRMKEKDVEKCQTNLNLCHEEMKNAIGIINQSRSLRDTHDVVVKELKELRDFARGFPSALEIRKAAKTSFHEVANALRKRMQDSRPYDRALFERIARLQQRAEKDIMGVNQTAAQSLSAFIDFYNTMFDQDYGLLKEAILT